MYEHLKFSLPQYIQSGFQDKVKQLCTKENVNVPLYLQRTPLHIAVICSQVKIISYLLTLQPNMESKDSLELTPADWALNLKNKHVLQILLPWIPYMDVQQKDWSQLNIFRAAQLSSKTLAQIIKKQNPHIKSQQFKRNALHWAALSGNKQSWDILINLKVNPYFQDQFGFNSFHYLKNNKFNSLYEMVKDFSVQEQIQKDYQVLIIGAGASGIGAGITLQRAGVPYLIIQARQRICGRLDSTFVDGIQVDLGACWVHSYTKNNAVCKQVKRLGWKPKQSENHYGAQIADEVIGKIPDKVMKAAQMHYQKFFEISEKNAKKSQVDISIYQAAEDYYKTEIQPLPKQVKRVVDMLINMTEHYQAACITQLSGKNYDQRTDSGGDFSPQKSYAALMNKIGSDLNVKLNTKVIQVEYAQNKVIVKCQKDLVFTSKKLVCSLPLGILKANTVKFSPPFPKEHALSIQRLGFGLMNKVIMAFETPFWDIGTSWVRIACQQRGKYPCMYNFSRNDKHVLCCFITDNFARKISSWSDQQIIKDISSVLLNAFKNKKIILKEVKITRWNLDPYALGSYTFFHKNSNIQNCFDLREPIMKTLWIVGEHCYGEHIGTAHGAFQTGVWAGEQIIANMKVIPKQFLKDYKK